MLFFTKDRVTPIVVSITEAEEGAASPTDVIHALTINGRTSSINLRYNF